jgi:hypothetical protein
MQEDLWKSNFHKTSIEIETLKLLNSPDRHKMETHSFLKDGIIQD